MEEIKGLTDKKVWENYYSGKGTLRVINRFFNQKIFDADIIDVLNKHLAGVKGELVEMGCGGSEWLVYLAKRFDFRISGVDYLERGCEISKSLLDDNSIADYQIICDDFFERHQRDSKRYDAVVSFGVIEHFDQPSHVLKAFESYLKDSGKIVTTCPNTGGAAMSLQKLFDKRVYYNHKRFELADLVNYHTEAGFKVIYSSYTGFLSFNNLVFGNFSIFGRLAKIAMKLLNAPLVYFFYLLKRYLNLNLENWFLSSNMVVVAIKK